MFKPKPVSLSDADIEQLEELSLLKRFQLRCKIVIFDHLGFKSKEIAMLLHCHVDTVWKTLRRWRRLKFTMFNQISNDPHTPDILFW